ncbi:phage tail tape measure protein [Serratia ureilytica]|uniref:phage tail tape measure protein n=1 Tax=Serratia ureilytica TaxID=300181 RepID=UPI00313C8785
MATLRELIIKISANSQSFQTEIARASRMGAEYYRVMEGGGRKSAAASRDTQRALADVTRQLNETRSAARSMAGAFAGAFATSQLIHYADTWGQLSGRLKLASTSTDDFSQAQRALMEVSQRTGTSLEANTTLYARIAQSMRDAGYASSDVAKVTETVATTLRLSGASAGEASSVVTQLSQALGSGVLRGDEFNSIMENGGRLAKLLADGLGTTVGGLRQMAQAGQLTTDKLIPILTNVDVLRKEFEQLPQSISGSAQKVENAFMAWVGGVNETSGASRVLAGTLDEMAENIDTVATAAGALVAVGLARYLGGLASGAASATAGLLTAARNEVALAQAQVRGTQVATARARAAVYRAQQALVAARGTEAQAAAEQKLNAAQTQLTRNIAARTAAQTALNSVTSVGMRVLSGGLGLIGGPAGLIMLAAGAWYTLYQNQEQARRSAQDYIRTLDEVREKTAEMKLPEAADHEDKTRKALDEQHRLTDEQAEKVRKLADEVKGYQQILTNPGPTVGGYMINHLTSLDDATRGLANATSALAVEQERLAQMQAKSQDIQSILEGLEHRRVELIRQQAAEQNAAYQSLLMMNGQHTEFNRLLGLGNTLLSARQGLVSAPVRIPAATLTSQQADLLLQSQQSEELSRLKGAARVRRQAEFRADKAGLQDTPEYKEARDRFIASEVKAYENEQANKPAGRTPKGKSDDQKAQDIYQRTVDQQRQQIALSGQQTEQAKIQYQISKGELSTLTQRQKTEVLRNAAALDQLKTQEAFKNLQAELLTPEEALLEKTRERIKLLKQAAPATDEYRKAMDKISRATIDDAPRFDGIDASVGGASGELLKVAQADKDLDKWHQEQIDRQKSLLDEKLINEQTYADRVAEINATNAERLKDIQAGYTSASLGMFGDLAGQSAALLQGIGQEGTAAYRMLFVASKAAAIAQAIINTELAATKAMAEGGLIFGMPAATMIRAAGYASVALIAGQTLAGMAHDGIDRVPETGTWLLQKGERVVTSSTSAKLDQTLEKVQQNRQGQQRVGDVNVNYHLTGKPDDTMVQMLDAHGKKLAKQIKQEMASDVINPQGKFGNALRAVYPNRRPT